MIHAMNPMDPANMISWVEEAPEDQREFREAVHVILSAITHDPELRGSMVMKGGILMGIRYHSPRFTSDIDFSSKSPLSELDPETIRKKLDSGMAVASTRFDYDLDCRVQSCKVNPPNRPEASFPSIELRIGHAYKGTAKHQRLMQGQSPSVVSIDLSLNELILEVENLNIDGGDGLRAYSLNDLVAEKIRSLLQQVVRNRFRRQDVYDLNLLLAQERERMDLPAILECLRNKASSRGIDVGVDSLDHPEIRERAKEEYHTLADEVEGSLPDFDAAYENLIRFYKSLPW
jgi:predicted nucleotidyltransferase component of viral defense system